MIIVANRFRLGKKKWPVYKYSKGDFMKAAIVTSVNAKWEIVKLKSLLLALIKY